MKSLSYASEIDILFFVRTFLTDILVALNLNMDFNSEISISHYKPDIIVLSIGRYLVGVVEVKKPGNDVLEKPTVLGELLDQMPLVEGFYGTRPLIGILTTGEEWIVSWFPGDTNTLAETNHTEASYSVPLKINLNRHPLYCSKINHQQSH